MILHRFDPPYCEIFEIRNTILNSDVPDTADRKTKKRTQAIPKRYALHAKAKKISCGAKILNFGIVHRNSFNYGIFSTQLTIISQQKRMKTNLL